MKKLFITIISMLLPILACADAVEINGIWYNLVSKVKTAEVASKPSGSYSGAIVIPDKVPYNGSEYRVTSIRERAFSSCYGLTSITIPNSVTSIGDYAFDWCTNLTSVTIPNSVTSIGERAFSSCHGLTSITIPNSVTTIGRSVFSQCYGLTSITIPNSMTSIGYEAFYNCSNLTSVIIPNSVTYIGYRAFENSGLISITIPNSVTSIDESAFSQCDGLTSITIPNSVTYIGATTFYGCSGLISITIGNGVKTIGGGAFAQCPELADVYCKAEELSSTYNYDGSGPLYTVASAFEGSYIEHATLHIPESAINAYKTTEPWSGFGTFVMLSGEGTETPKCATPTISIEDGKIKFSCETEGVEFVSNVSTTDTKDYYDAELTLAYKYKVTVYATKEGYENSDTTTVEFTATGKFGDMNHDNKITVADAVIIIDMVMKNEE